jgi:hypothetical protein
LGKAILLVTQGFSARVAQKKQKNEPNAFGSFLSDGYWPV